MKKSIIKRRKRVVPVAQGTQTIDVANNSMESPDLEPQCNSTDRGSINPDGSINLGFRLRNDQQRRSLLPEPSLRPLTGQQLPSSDLIAYASSSNTQSHPYFNEQHPESLNDNNRLPPMTSYPSPTNRRPSLSPNSFLSPSRKRSFSVTEMEPQPNSSEPTSTHPNRLSSIKSILNPGFNDSDDFDTANQVDPNLQKNSGKIHAATNSPASGNDSGQYATGLSSDRVSEEASEKEGSKLERRETLQREADRMREALKAKERELADLE